MLQTNNSWVGVFKICTSGTTYNRVKNKIPLSLISTKALGKPNLQRMTTKDMYI